MGELFELNRDLNFGECIFYVTMSKMSQMSKLKNHIKNERSKIFKKRTDAQSCAKFAQLAQKFSKNRTIFYYPRLLQCMQIIWVNIFKQMGFGIEFNLINIKNNFINHRNRIYEVKFFSKTHLFDNIYPDNVHALYIPGQ